MTRRLGRAPPISATLPMSWFCSCDLTSFGVPGWEKFGVPIQLTKSILVVYQSVSHSNRASSISTGANSIKLKSQTPGQKLSRGAVPPDSGPGHLHLRSDESADEASTAKVHFAHPDMVCRVVCSPCFRLLTWELCILQIGFIDLQGGRVEGGVYPSFE